MRNDEFNEAKVTNEKEVFPIEFGKTQPTEFSSYQDSPSYPKEELNVNKEQSDKKQESTDKKNNEEIIKEATQEAVSTTTGAEVAGTVATSATAVAVVGAVSMVIVGGVANTARVEFDYLQFSGHEIVYSCQLHDTGGEKFFIYCEGDDYLSYHQIGKFEEWQDEEMQKEGGWGYFDDIKANSTYRIYVKQADPSIKIIYDETIVTTIKEPTFNIVEFGKFNTDTMSFTVSLSYEDENYVINDLQLVLSNSLYSEAYSLSTYNGTQTVYVATGSEDKFDFIGEMLDYSIQYKKEGEEEFIEAMSGKVTFEAEEIVYNPYFNNVVFGKYNPETMTFSLALDYEDNSELITDLQIILTNGEITEEYPLDLTTDEQVVSVNGDGRESQFIYEQEELRYIIQYKTKDSSEFISGLSGQIQFEVEEIIYQPVFNGVSFGKYNPETMEFTVSVDYEDYSSIVSEIILTLTAEDIVEEYPLELTTTSQTISTNGDGRESQLPFLDEYEMSYSVKYKTLDSNDYVEPLSGAVTFEIEEIIYEPVFIDVDFGQYNSENRTFTIMVRFEDESSVIDQLQLVLSDGSFLETFPLEVNPETQIVEVSGNSSLVFEQEEFTYSIQYKRLDGEDFIEALTGQIQFEIEQIIHEPTFNEVTFGKYNPEEMFFTISVNYEDLSEQITDMQIILTNGEITEEYPLDLTTDEQVVSVNGDGRESQFIYEEEELSYIIQYKTKDNNEFIDALNGNIQFEVEVIIHEPEFSGVEFSAYDTTTNSFTVKLTYEDLSSVLEEIKITFSDNNNEESFNLEVTPEAQGVVVSEGSMLDFASELTYVIEYKVIDNNEFSEGLTGTHTFEITQSRYVGDLIWDKKANFNNNSFEIQLDYVDPDDEYSDFTLTLSSTNENPDIYYDEEQTEHQQVFSLNKTTDKQTLRVEDSNIINIVLDTFTYEFSYVLDGETIVQETGTVNFENSLVTEFYDITSTYTVHEVESSTDTVIPMKFNYIDEGNYYNGFYIVLDGDEENAVTVETTNTYQFAITTNFTLAHQDDATSIYGREMSLQLFGTKFDPKGEQSEEEMEIYSTTVTLEQGNTTQVFGLFISSMVIDANFPSLTVRPIYLNSDETIVPDSFVMIIETDDGTRYRLEIEPLNNIYVDVTYLYLDDYPELIEYLRNNPVNIYLEYKYSNGNETVTDELLCMSEVTFTIYESA